MTRVNILLLVAVLASALFLVRLQYQSRTIYTAVDAEQVRARKLDNEREALDVQKRAQAAALHIESTARSRLGMREATPAITQYVQYRDGRTVISGPAAVPASAAATSATARSRP
ncbi:MAG: cell division protein FtsL [Brachymonas sp.]|nr:cell division protein FtsL [Brachymonas sp.]